MENKKKIIIIIQLEKNTLHNYCIIVTIYINETTLGNLETSTL